MKLLRFAGVLIITIVFSLAGTVCAKQALEGKIVPGKYNKTYKRIHLGRSSVDPGVITIEAGTNVMWFNDTHQAIEIEFVGKAVNLVCKKPRYFFPDHNGVFTSSRIPDSSRASLCFVEKGEYDFVAHTVSFHLSSMPRQLKGKIIVK